MSDLKAITALAQSMLECEREIAEAEEALKQLKARHQKITEVDLPEAMDSVGLQDFTTSDGRKIALSSDIYASISGVNREAAHEWLRKHKFDSIIKRTITVVFGRGEDKKARYVLRNLNRYKSLVDNTIKGDETIHSQTLRAFVRNAMADGMDIPTDLFGVYEKRVCKVVK